MYNYDSEYAKRYIENTLSSPYTVYKNATIATLLNDAGTSEVWDLGGNVSGLMKLEGSLRFQLNKHGITYNAIDLSPAYFSRSFALSLEQPNENIYSTRSGIVGDMRNLPMRDQTADAVVCADVIEHIENPEQALSEMYRVLRPGGKAVIVIPSLYKLDAIKVPHILHKRFSSHENRFTTAEWITLLTQAGFAVDVATSQPLGIASGLLYTSWLNPDYVPVRPDEHSKEEFSEQANQFRLAKRAVGQVDHKIDNLKIKHPHMMSNISSKFMQGDIVGILKQIEEWYNQVSLVPNEYLHNLVSSFDPKSISIEAMSQLQTTLQTNDEAIKDDAFFGNSALLVLHK